MERKIRTIVSTSKCGRKAQVITDGNETKHVRLVNSTKAAAIHHVYVDADENTYRYGV